MTALARIALEFCRECMGWEIAQSSRMFNNSIAAKNGEGDRLAITDLNAVMSAAREWCDKNEAGVEMSYYGYLPGEWEVSVSTSVSAESITSTDLCLALMAACIAASRKLKAVP